MATGTYPNSVQCIFHYDKLNLAIGLASQQTGCVYRLGPLGNLTSAPELNNRQVTWNYDGIYLLTDETSPKRRAGKMGGQLRSDRARYFRNPHPASAEN